MDIVVYLGFVLFFMFPKKKKVRIRHVFANPKNTQIAFLLYITYLQYNEYFFIQYLNMEFIRQLFIFHTRL